MLNNQRNHTRQEKTITTMSPQRTGLSQRLSASLSVSHQNCERVGEHRGDSYELWATTKAGRRNFGFMVASSASAAWRSGCFAAQLLGSSLLVARCSLLAARCSAAWSSLRCGAVPLTVRHSGCAGGPASPCLAWITAQKTRVAGC